MGRDWTKYDWLPSTLSTPCYLDRGYLKLFVVLIDGKNVFMLNMVSGTTLQAQSGTESDAGDR